MIGALNSSFCGLYVPCKERFFLAINTNTMSPNAAMKSRPAIVGMTATKMPGFSHPGYVLELGGFEIGGVGVVLLTVMTL